MSTTRVRTPGAQPSRAVAAHFRVAISYASENANKVGPVARLLGVSLGRGAVFYDEFEGHAISGFGAERRLRDIYARADLVVVFVDAHYADSPWCRAEWEAIRLRHASGGDVMLFRLDDRDISGLGSGDLHLDAGPRSPEELHELIAQRLHTLRPPAKSVAGYAAAMTLVVSAAMGWVWLTNAPGGRPRQHDAAEAAAPTHHGPGAPATMRKSQDRPTADAVHSADPDDSQYRPMSVDWRRCSPVLTEAERKGIEVLAEEMVGQERRSDPRAWESMRTLNGQIDVINTRRIEAWIALGKPTNTPPPPMVRKLGQLRTDGTLPGGTAIAKPTQRPIAEPAPERPPVRRRSSTVPPRVVIASLCRAADADGAPPAALTLADQPARRPARLRLDVQGIAAPVALVVFHAATGALVTLRPRFATGDTAGFELPAEVRAPELRLHLVELAATPNFADLSALGTDQPLAVSLRPIGS